jgi:hypothetical protein
MKPSQDIQTKFAENSTLEKVERKTIFSNKDLTIRDIGDEISSESNRVK